MPITIRSRPSLDPLALVALGVLSIVAVALVAIVATVARSEGATLVVRVPADTDETGTADPYLSAMAASAA